MKLSKTDYLIYKDCSHNAWLKVHRRDVYNAEPLSEFDRNIIDTGNEVDLLARGLFPGGVTVERGDKAGTAVLVAQRTPVLYQPVFETERFTTACDVLVWNSSSAVYDLFEVKSSSNGGDKGAKDQLYTYDIGFQAEVLRQNQVPLGKLYLVRLSSDYERGDHLEIAQLFTQEDFTGRVEAVADEIAAEMDQAHDLLSSSQSLPPPCGCMTRGRSSHCTTFAYTNPAVPTYSIHDISRIGSSRKKLAALISRGILSIEDVPADFALSGVQANQVRAAKTRHAIIERDAIAEFLDELRYPLTFLDYETFAAAIPRFARYRPYEHIPFQFSLDVVENHDVPLAHHEFLHLTSDCPDEKLVKALQEAMPPSGSIIVWHQSFERGINDRLAARNPQFSDWLGDLDPRIIDLEDVFSMQAYVHPGFRGKTSIKYVLPTLVPGFSYKALPIQEGATASARWNEVVTGSADTDAANKIRTDLLAYCGLDTRAMFEIWRVLEDERAAERKVG